MDVGGGVTRDVDVVASSTDIVSLTGNRTRASARGHVSVAFIDSTTGVHYSGFEFTGGAFVLNVGDGTPDTFGLTLYRPDRTVFHAVSQQSLASGDVVDHL